MISRLTSLWLVCVLAAAAPAGAQTATGEVSVRVNAVGVENPSLIMLGRGDVRVTDEGNPREVTSVLRLIDMPLSLVVAIDNSVSQERVLGGTKLAASAFVRSVLRPDKDEAAVVTFTGETTMEQDLTSDVDRLSAAIARVRVAAPPGYIGGGVIVSPGSHDPQPVGPTSLWDAVWVISRDILAREPREVRRCLLLVTDGIDTFSRVKLGEAVRAAQREEIAVYAIGVADEKNFGGVAKGDLRKLTEPTGGRAFFPKKLDELPAIFQQIRAELLSPYVVTFAAPDAGRAGSFRKLKLEITNPELRARGVKLSHPEGYFVR